jgi:hypothetical protein
MPSVCIGSWNERHRLVCLAVLRLLSRTVAAESMRHLTKSRRAHAFQPRERRGHAGSLTRLAGLSGMSPGQRGRARNHSSLSRGSGPFLGRAGGGLATGV